MCMYIIFFYIIYKSIIHKDQSKTEAKKKIRHSHPDMLSLRYLTQRNIILTFLIILTDVLFLSQKKKNIFLLLSFVQAKAGRRLLLTHSNYQNCLLILITCFWSLYQTTLLQWFCMPVNGPSITYICITHSYLIVKNRKMQMQNAIWLQFRLQFICYHPCSPSILVYCSACLF